MNNLQIFDNEVFGTIRIVTTEAGVPLFCLADVARALGYSSPAKAVIDHCKGVTVVETPTSGGLQQMKYGSEGSVYRLVMKSKLPDAEKFQEWVCDEVLPAIRKTGGYLVAHHDDTTEEILARAVIVASDTISRIKNQLAQKDIVISVQQEAIKEAAPKVEYCDKVLQSEGCIPITLIAKELGMSAMALNTKLFKAKIQYKVGGTWVLYAPHENKGWTKTLTFDPSMTGLIARVSTYWTQEGRRMIHRDFS